ncbi:hypothetical protein E5676_scaffold828G00560 [Cucumis melo var. makuwa]|uniref:Uncharacterized protein n=1 Tax=Cucumis melo var. makuwa TaxID=1194695 RepID=A0A5A7V8U7_CUCMM|nr:hypothetical protein E6C27_scaffold508G00570 [Cucumis melo var. makuwa]TYK11679.1 hypothetical protein E5676_scaffold828G00560 [Cucumis melo var. makuwa]
MWCSRWLGPVAHTEGEATTSGDSDERLNRKGSRSARWCGRKQRATASEEGDRKRKGRCWSKLGKKKKKISRGGGVAKLPTQYAYHFGDKTKWGAGNIITQDEIHSFSPLENISTVRRVQLSIRFPS